MVKKLCKVVILFILLQLLTGCFDYMDVDKTNIAIGGGIDYNPRNNTYLSMSEFIQVRRLKTDNLTQAKSSGMVILMGEGKNWDDARLYGNELVSFPFNLLVVRSGIWGKNIAQKDVEIYVNRIAGAPGYRQTFPLVISREPVIEILKIQPRSDISVAFLIEGMMNQLASSGTGLFVSIGDIISAMAFKDIGYVIPYIGIEKGLIKYIGLAVFKDSKLIGKLDTKESLGVVYLLSKRAIIPQVIPSPQKDGNDMSFTTVVMKKKFKTNYINEKIVIQIDMDIMAQLNHQYYVKPITNEIKKRMEDILSDKVKNDILTQIKRSQEEFKCDFYGFAKHFRAEHARIFKQIDWVEKYPDADIQVNIKTNIKSLGMIDPNAEKKY